MVKREEMPRPTDILVKPAPAAPWPALMSAGSDQERRGQEPMKEEPASIGKSIVIKGELSGGEDLTIEGQVEGKIDLRDQVLTIGSNGRIKAEIVARSIVVLGHVTGDLTASDKVDIRENGSVEGDVSAPRIAIADGSHFRGSIDMQRPEPSREQVAGVLNAKAKAGMVTVPSGTDEHAIV